MTNNIFAVYKQVGMTSHDVVNIVRKKTGIKRVGHGGTLDPFAEGVLVIAVGRENTKLLDAYTKGDKEYTATLHLGYTSTTEDTEGEKTEINTKHKPTIDEIKKVIPQFIGEIKQVPSSYSAIKIDGKEAYKRIRKGEKFEMEERTVTITDIQIVNYIYPELEIHVSCKTGTYIRSLARDIGEKLQTGAYLTKLVRTKVGEFSLENVRKIEEM